MDTASGARCRHADDQHVLFPRRFDPRPRRIRHASFFRTHGSEHAGVTNIGVRPTVNHTDSVTAETFILDFPATFTVKGCALEFYKGCAPNSLRRVEELKAQILKGRRPAARGYFDSI
jgi:FAD synthase